jgi:excisionase family DNA binding protein
MHSSHERRLTPPIAENTQMKPKPEYVSVEQIEPLMTMSEFAATLGVPVFKIRRAVKAGVIATYNIGTRRKLIRPSEGMAAIERSRQGAAS